MEMSHGSVEFWKRRWVRHTFRQTARSLFPRLPVSRSLCRHPSLSRLRVGVLFS
jgi:hypothetical protein